MIIYYVGIDPSMNSTGICIQKYDNDIKIKEDFIILKSVDERKDSSKWLTKKEKIAEEHIDNFLYLFYNKVDLTEFKTDNHLHEYWKSYNMCMCANTIKHIVNEFTKDNPSKIYLVMEGISYGSVQRTKSIFDLAGLNYLVREKFILQNGLFESIIATPSEIKQFASGNGNCNKEVMINLFIMSHPNFEILPKIDDIADAYYMSNYAKQNIMV